MVNSYSFLGLCEFYVDKDGVEVGFEESELVGCVNVGEDEVLKKLWVWCLM